MDEPEPVKEEIPKSTDSRTAAEKLSRIREMFSASVTELSNVLGVSRRTIYNWEARKQVAEDYIEKLDALAKAADIMETCNNAQRQALEADILGRKIPEFTPQMADPFEQLMADLRAWDATAKHGAQKALAERLGVSRATLNNWIKGRKAPNVKDGLKLKQILEEMRPQ